MTCPSAVDTALELDFSALYFGCRRVLSKAQLAGVQNPDPLVQTGLRIITPKLVLKFSPDPDPDPTPTASLTTKSLLTWFPNHPARMLRPPWTRCTIPPVCFETPVTHVPHVLSRPYALNPAYPLYPVYPLYHPARMLRTLIKAKITKSVYQRSMKLSNSHNPLPCGKA